MLKAGADCPLLVVIFIVWDTSRALAVSLWLAVFVKPLWSIYPGRFPKTHFLSAGVPGGGVSTQYKIVSDP